jgi:hypothetical protein
MHAFKFLLLIITVILLGAPKSEAHVLVYRARLAGAFSRETSDGKLSKETMPSTLSYLFFIDLDTDCWIELDGEGTSAESIALNEQPKTSKAPAAKSFTHYPDNAEDGKDHRSTHKFAFYSNNKKFFYIYMNSADYGDAYDTGVILANGSCKLNVSIGGGRKSAGPVDFTAPIKRGDGHTFKTGVMSFKYDAAITTAVNNYLNANSIRSTGGEGVSVSIPAATNWLIEDYLPKNFPATFPEEYLE